MLRLVVLVCVSWLLQVLRRYVETQWVTNNWQAVSRGRCAILLCFVRWYDEGVR